MNDFPITLEDEQILCDKENAQRVFSPEFIPYYPEIAKRFNLTPYEAITYGFIRFYMSSANTGARFYFTNEQLAKIVGCSEISIEKIIRRLKEKNLIKVAYKIKAGGGKVRFVTSVFTDLVKSIDYEPIKTMESESIKTMDIIDNKINDNKINKYICDFDSFWNIYPKKVGKKKSEEIYKRKVVSKEIEEGVMEGIRKYIGKWKGEATDIKYIPNPMTWLNQERWEDEVVISNEQFNRNARKFEMEMEEIKQRERRNYQEIKVDDGNGGMVKLSDLRNSFNFN